MGERGKDGTPVQQQFPVLVLSLPRRLKSLFFPSFPLVTCRSSPGARRKLALTAPWRFLPFTLLELGEATTRLCLTRTRPAAAQLPPSVPPSQLYFVAAIKVSDCNRHSINKPKPSPRLAGCLLNSPVAQTEPKSLVQTDVWLKLL